jgi:hypothetical protein
MNFSSLNRCYVTVSDSHILILNSDRHWLVTPVSPPVSIPYAFEERKAMRIGDECPPRTIKSFVTRCRFDAEMQYIYQGP